MSSATRPVRGGISWSAFVGSASSVGSLRSISIALLCRCSSGGRAVVPLSSVPVSLDAEDNETNGLKDVFPDSAASPSDQAVTNEHALAVRQAVAFLPEDLRTAMILAEYEGLPHAQIATILKCTPKAVENRLYRARARLRQRLESLLQPG